MPIINIRSQRHSTIFSTVLTFITIIGKVKNINQMDVKKDFFISSRVITFTSVKKFVIIDLLDNKFHRIDKARMQFRITKK